MGLWGAAVEVGDVVIAPASVVAVAGGDIKAAQLHLQPGLRRREFPIHGLLNPLAVQGQIKGILICQQQGRQAVSLALQDGAHGGVGMVGPCPRLQLGRSLLQLLPLFPHLIKKLGGKNRDKIRKSRPAEWKESTKPKTPQPSLLSLGNADSGRTASTPGTGSITSPMASRSKLACGFRGEGGSELDNDGLRSR
jgi:hypothetical protein